MEDGSENRKPVWTEDEIEEILKGMEIDPWEENSQEEINQECVVSDSASSTSEVRETQEDRKPEVLSSNEYVEVPYMKIKGRIGEG